MKILFRVIVALLLLLAAAEGIARFFLPAPKIPRLPMLKQVADPNVGYRLAPNQTAFTLEAPVRTNRWGYRGKDWALEKPVNTFRIAVLGASLTFGHGLEEEEIFTSKLERLLNENPPVQGMKYEVLNFGVGGYDLGHSLNVLKQDVLAFKPDAVLANLFMGDVFYVSDYSFYPEFFRLQEQNFSRFRWEFLNFCRRFRLAMYVWDLVKDHLWGREPDEVSRMIRTYAIDGLHPLEGPQAEGWRFITERLKEYGEITRAHGIPAYFMVLPTHEEISDPAAKSTYGKYLQEQCEAYGIHYIWLIQEVRKNQKLVESFLIPYDFHFTKEGHTWIAGLLKDRLFQNHQR